jgi:hypothetical protein
VFIKETGAAARRRAGKEKGAGKFQLLHRLLGYHEKREQVDYHPYPA